MGSTIDGEMAANLFGNANLKNSSFEMLAPSALALLCRNSDAEKSFPGFNFQGFDFGFCNDTWTVQTDVGVCIGGNPSQILMNGIILKQDQPRKINGGLKDIEHSDGSNNVRCSKFDRSKAKFGCSSSIANK